MVQRYTTQSSSGESKWSTDRFSFKFPRACRKRECAEYPEHQLRGSYSRVDVLNKPADQQWYGNTSEPFNLQKPLSTCRETGGIMLNITGLNNFYYLRDFHDMRCKYEKVLSIIHQQCNKEPEEGDVFIVMSKDQRLVRLFNFEHNSFSLYEKKYVNGYKFMKIEYEDGKKVHSIDWQDVVLILQAPVVKTLKINKLA